MGAEIRLPGRPEEPERWEWNSGFVAVVRADRFLRRTVLKMAGAG
jgi:hypothetical protein